MRALLNRLFPVNRLFPERHPATKAPAPVARRGRLALSGNPRGGHGHVYTRPGWWHSALPQNGLMYPDDNLLSLMEELRRTLPLVDRALSCLVQLCGEIKVEGDKAVVDELNQWLCRVPNNQLQHGFQTFAEAHLCDMLLYGKGVCEFVPNRGRTDIACLVNVDPRSIVYRVTDDPLKLDVLQRQTHAFELKSLNPTTVLVSVNQGRTDRPHGMSLFQACPFVARAQRLIENATAQQWQRIGAPPFHINWQADPKEEFYDPQATLAQEVLSDLKASWDNVMTAKDLETNEVTDMFSSGNVTISTLGMDGQPLLITEPYRVFAEQIIGVTGIPAFLLGMHWSRAERMAGTQAEVMLAFIKAIRRSVQVQFEQLIDWRQRLAGKSGKVKLRWSDVTLHDAVEKARAACWEEQARQRKIANETELWNLGLIDQRRVSMRIDPHMGPIARPLPAPPAAPPFGPGSVDPTDPTRMQEEG